MFVLQFGIDTNFPVIDGLVAWYDAGDPSFVSIETGVSQLNDRSFTANHMTQGSVTDQPDYSGSLNGYGIMSFDGLSQFLQASQPAVIQGDEARTIVVVTRANTGQTMYALNNSNGAGNVWNMKADFSIACGGGITQVFTSDVIDATEHYIVSCALPSGGSANDISGRINGADIAVDGGASTDGVVTSDDGNARIGRNSSGVRYDGVVGEALVYDKILSPDEILAVETSLSNKWGIALV